MYMVHHQQRVKLSLLPHNTSIYIQVLVVCNFYFPFCLYNLITMAEIVHQNVTAMTAPRWQSYLQDVVRVAPAFGAVDEFIQATAFNLPDTIRLIDEKGWT